MFDYWVGVSRMRVFFELSNDFQYLKQRITSKIVKFCLFESLWDASGYPLK